VPADIVEGLKKLGHQTTSVVGPLGGGQAIWIDWDKGTLTGGSDPRKDGCALGY
jgi:gamma-glutamyltranspeptidase/glutathione hydrolase